MPQSRLVILAPLKAWGGIEGKIVTLAREFLAQGVAVELMLARGGQVPYPERLPNEVRITDLTSRGKASTTLKLARRLRWDPPDAILTAKDHAAKAAVLARALSGSRVPIFIKLTNTPSKILRRSGKRQLAKWLYPRADGAIAISEGVRDDFLSHFRMAPERVTTIYNPTITPDFPDRMRRPVEHPWLTEKAFPVVLGIGRLTPQKDFATLVQAFAAFRKRQEARLIILGEGPLRGELENQASRLGIGDAVDLPGFVPDPLPWLARANLFTLSSRYEGLGNVLIEALAAGTPAVSTDCLSGPREILQNGRLGELVAVGDAQGMAGAMERSLDRLPPREQLEESLNRFRSGPVARRYLTLMGLVPPAG
jgi:glycosyltransferase involved in cell wall biosynthesis